MVLCRRRNAGAEGSMVATGAAEDTKESGREGTDLGWASRGGRLPFTWPYQNTDSMKGTGKSVKCLLSVKLTDECLLE